ncbi:MAG: DUF4837 family protein [Flavobacteriaceae bacterium]|nr:DUF4837 family protein [Flavobacteriaceae bacterium]
MNKGLTIIGLLFFLVSCVDANESFVLRGSIGKTNKILVVVEVDQWNRTVGDEVRNFMGEFIPGLPQPETIFSVSQVSPKGFRSVVMRANRSVLVLGIAKTASFSVKTDVFASPQTIVYVTATDKEGLVEQLKKHSKEIIATFKASEIKVTQQRFYKEKLDDSKFKTLQNLGISLTIPKIFRTVDDTGDFLWLRQHLLSGIARGDGTNNILVYSVPLSDENEVINTILPNRDTIGKRYIPGSKEGMYMITEAAYTPVTIPSEVANIKAFETRGKWEVKNDFMAGPFINFTIIDTKNNRLIVVEGFTYAPSVNKREFIFELEAIAKSLKIQ